MRALAIFITTLVTLVLSSCDSQGPRSREHVLVGGWLAEDGTIFNFRSDGTFHGIDWRSKEIWGNWVTLSDTRIGFQSLLHDSSYEPQYAIIDKTNHDAMDYIVTGGDSFIHAKRISPDKADAATELVVEPRLHYPTPPAKPAGVGQ
jgi:hypothetical protein